MSILQRIKESSLYIRLYVVISIIIVLGLIARNTLEFKSIEDDARSDSLAKATNIFNYIEAFYSTYNHLIDTKQLSPDNLMLLPAHSVNSIYEQYSDLSNGDFLIRSVSNAARNPHNEAYAFEKMALQQFEKRTSEAYFDEVKLNGEPYYFYARPILVEPLCLECHGQKSSAPQYIQESYTKGFGYEVGDVRGLTSLLISKSSQTQEVKRKYWERVYVSVGIVIISILMLYMIVRRLTHNEQLLIKKLNRLSYVDQLTQVNNRRSLDKYLLEFIAIYKRYETPFSIILVDIDHFKRVNDTYGHLEGDAVLVKTAQTLTHSLRTTDILGRWGGEEFVIIAPHIQVDEAVILANKIRLKIASERFGDVGELTISCGVSEIAASDTVETLLSRVDEALYEAKEGGRNQVVAK
jgi:diguanylate cyclase (GGDEF)-like protein